MTNDRLAEHGMHAWRSWLRLLARLRAAPRRGDPGPASLSVLTLDMSSLPLWLFLAIVIGVAVLGSVVYAKTFLRLPDPVAAAIVGAATSLTCLVISVRAELSPGVLLHASLYALAIGCIWGVAYSFVPTPRIEATPT